VGCSSQKKLVAGKRLSELEEVRFGGVAVPCDGWRISLNGPMRQSSTEATANHSSNIGHAVETFIQVSIEQGCFFSHPTPFSHGIHFA
jgi:hypothetical protein